MVKRVSRVDTKPIIRARNLQGALSISQGGPSQTQAAGELRSQMAGVGGGIGRHQGQRKEAWPLAWLRVAVWGVRSAGGLAHESGPGPRMSPEAALEWRAEQEGDPGVFGAQWQAGSGRIQRESPAASKCLPVSSSQSGRPEPGGSFSLR